jgi:hypothetical protein
MGKTFCNVHDTASNARDGRLWLNLDVASSATTFLDVIVPTPRNGLASILRSKTMFSSQEHNARIFGF